MHILGSLNPVANQGLDPLSQDTDPRIRIPKKKFTDPGTRVFFFFLLVKMLG
jgi:hypothetical protein